MHWCHVTINQILCYEYYEILYSLCCFYMPPQSNLGVKDNGVVIFFFFSSFS